MAISLQSGSNRWSQLDAGRSQHLDRARLCAELTIPSLLPPQSADENTPLPTPNQGMGARCTNNLAAKLLLAFLPPNTPFFRYLVPAALEAELKESDPTALTKAEKFLGERELSLIRFMEGKNYRPQLYKVMRLLIVTGNALVEYLKKGGVKVHRLDHYVVRRNPEGTPIEIILKELITPEEIPESVNAQLAEGEGPGADKALIELFTIMRIQNGRWHLHQEVLGIPIQETVMTYSERKFPFYPQAWTLAEGENYGRGHVEEYLGDFVALDSMSRALTDAALAAAKILFLNHPNSSIKTSDLKKAPNAGFVTGKADDIDVLQLDKYADFKVASERVDKIEHRLSEAFLLRSSVQRQAERVTAEEIRYMVQELEDSLGGIYSVLSVELQLPMVKMVQQQMKAASELGPMLPGVEPMITTGFDALGRGHDLAKLKGLLEDLAPLGPATIAKYMKVANYIDRCATARGIKTEGLIPTAEEIAQADQREQMQQMIEKLGPNAINQMGSMAGQEPQAPAEGA